MRRMRRQQRGIVAVVVAVSLLALLLMVGLAIDIGHLALNKSRLQSTVDAAALSAAKELDLTHSTAAATAAANSMFALNAADHPDLRKDLGNVTLTVQFSQTLNPFVPGSTPPEYVRVRAGNFSTEASFTRLLGFDKLPTRASAVAGPSAPIPNPCDLFPVAVCAFPGSTAPYWGYVPYGTAGNTVTPLKQASPAEPSIGEGNFQLLAMLDSKGKSDLRQNLAAGLGCAGIGDIIPTEPGNAATIRAAVNTRFDIYRSPFAGTRSVFPPDHVVTPNDPASLPLSSDDGVAIMHYSTTITGIDDVAYSYVNYQHDYEPPQHFQNPLPVGRPMRRVVTVPIIKTDDCGPTHGRKPVTVVGFGTFFLLQPMCEPGNCPSGKEGWIFGQFLGEGEATGTPGPVGGVGPYKIVLHNDPDSQDS